MHIAMLVLARSSSSLNTEPDATLLNGHLEWLTKVGFSVDNILEWAEAEKSKRGTDSTQQSALSAELTVSVPIGNAFTDGGSRSTDAGPMHNVAPSEGALLPQSQSSATVDDSSRSNLEDFTEFHSGSGHGILTQRKRSTHNRTGATGCLSKKHKAIEARVDSESM